MIGAIIKATFGSGNNTNTVIKTYSAETKELLDLKIMHDIKKYGYTKVEPLTAEQYEQQKDKI